ncbi:hypothetical protein HDF12_002734 [Edaphobacter lichenicola]|uniref:Uncharacterized protein n=1 Tax=Tunturiibacter lichenicola TaxID=2051959 RepID=A0A7Y9TAI4_9BACT|nr:hypothetical protein [Edaphobacter lichenicola]
MSNLLFSREISSLVQTNGLPATRVVSIFKSKPAKPCSATLKPGHRTLEEMLAGHFYQSCSFIWQIGFLSLSPAPELLMQVEIGELPTNMRRPSRTVRFIVEFCSFGYPSDVW